MEKQIKDKAENSNMVKDPDDWTTGDEPMTGAQKFYLSTLSEEAGEEMDEIYPNLRRQRKSMSFSVKRVED